VRFTGDGISLITGRLGILCNRSVMNMNGLSNDELNDILKASFATREELISTIQRSLGNDVPCKLIRRNKFRLECSQRRQGCQLFVNYKEVSGLLCITSHHFESSHPSLNEIRRCLAVSDPCKNVQFYYFVHLNIDFKPEPVSSILEAPLLNCLFDVKPEISIPANALDIDRIRKHYQGITEGKGFDSLIKATCLDYALKVAQLPSLSSLPRHKTYEIIKRLLDDNSDEAMTEVFCPYLSPMINVGYSDPASLLSAVQSSHQDIVGYSSQVQRYTYRVYQTRLSGTFNSHIECSEKPRGCPFRVVSRIGEDGICSITKLTSSFHHVHSTRIALCAKSFNQLDSFGPQIEALTQRQAGVLRKLLSL
jgi:hypothetical protein